MQKEQDIYWNTSCDYRGEVYDLVYGYHALVITPNLEQVLPPINLQYESSINLQYKNHI